MTSPKILAILPGVMPSTLIYIVKPFLRLQADGHIRLRVALEAYLNANAIAWADLVVFCRNVEPRYGYILDLVRSRGLPYIYDIDDNLFEVPDQVADGDYYRAPERLALLTEYLRHASLVRVYSNILKERFLPLNANTIQVRPTLDWSLISPPRSKKASERVKIVYATSRRDDYLFPIFTDALHAVLQDYPARVEMHFWGFHPSGLQNAANVYFHKFEWNYDQFLRRFSSAGFDIGLAPMLDDGFHRAKTNTKFREYGACGIAGIYSKAALYTECVSDGETGLLVENEPAAWRQAMQTLIEDVGLRDKIRQSARQRVRQLYSQKQFQQEWLQLIERVLDQNQKQVGTSAQLSHPLPRAVADLPERAGPSNLGIWREKLGRGIELMKGGEIQRSIFNSRVHMNNLWWLFKVNILKHL
ncbi:MAG: glycosyltransferase [Anaerolineales bacterium]|nr:glycosyltransferase [Anaerolineales bacterium]